IVQLHAIYECPLLCGFYYLFFNTSQKVTLGEKSTSYCLVRYIYFLALLNFWINLLTPHHASCLLKKYLNFLIKYLQQAIFIMKILYLNIVDHTFTGINLATNRSKPKSIVGTPAYIAHEVLLKKEYNGKVADVWSCGVTPYVMLTITIPEIRNHPWFLKNLLADQMDDNTM
ncbi:hypothetical protein ACJX0J_040156, partial [Zea mays]